MLIEMLNIVGPIMLITAIGFALGKSSVGLQTHSLSSLVILIATPSLVFHSLVSLHVSREALATMSFAALLCIGVSFVFSVTFLKIFNEPLRSFLPSMMLPNSGNMGLPLAVLSFGSEGMALGVAFFFVIAMFQYSVGLSISAGSVQLRAMAKQPLVYSIVLVLVVLLLDILVPTIILNTTKMLGGMMIPTMLILLGASLATLRVADLKPAFVVAFGRLFAGLISAFVVVFVLDLQGIAAGVTFLLATMSAAIVTYVFAERYNQNSEQVAGAVMISTLLTFLCLPVLVWMSINVSNGGLGAVFTVTGQ